MNILAFAVFVLVFKTVLAQRDSPCVTPNNETATCMGVSSCKVITDAVLTKAESARDFAKESQCGHDTEELVCCGSLGDFQPLDIFNIFTEAPNPFNIFTKEPDLFDIFTTVPGTWTEASKQQPDIDSNGLPDRTVCGLDYGTSRIIGGEQTDMEEFPWMAALEYKTIRTGAIAGIRCGGTVINNRHILTAAHCILNGELILYRVWLGDWRFSTDPDCETYLDKTECADKVLKLSVKERIAHPFYSGRTGDNDIGLLRLKSDINYSNYIRPICLPQSDLPPPAHGTKLTVTGWGATENGTSSDIKLKVLVPLISNTKCHEKLGANRKANANQLCAGGEERKDSCRGDSGGPLMRMYEDKTTQQARWYQEGVVSYGVGCGRVGFPAIYTRLSRYSRWIITNIKT